MIENHRPLYSDSSLNMKSSVIRDMFRITSDPAMISFAGGLPGADAFPVEELHEIINRSISRYGSSVFQYGTTEGHQLLREGISSLMNNAYGLSHEPDNILVTSGSQQALYLLCKVLLNPGDTIITENPTYVGAISTFRSFMADIHSIDMNSQGMDIAALESKISELVSAGKKPRFIYTIPSIHNPTGITMGVIQRHMLYETASKYDIMIIEDDPYGMIRYDDLKIGPVKKLDTGNRAVYLGSFSKTVSPGLRTGWIAGQKELVRRCTIAKQGEDTCSGTLSQFIISDFIADGSIYRQIEKVRGLYMKKRDLMAGALKSMIPAASFDLPGGGLFLWITLPENIDTSKLLAKTIERQVAYVPGTAFFADGSGTNLMRLNFSYPSFDDIGEGIKRMAGVINDELSMTQ